MGHFVRQLAFLAAFMAIAGPSAASSAQTLELEQRLRLEPGKDASAAIPAGVKSPRIVSSAPEVARARVEQGRVIVTGVKEGVATVTFTGEGWSDLLTGAPPAAVSDAGYGIRESVAVEVTAASAVAAAPKPVAPAAPQQALKFRRDLALEPGRRVRIPWAGAASNVKASSNAPAVQASVVEGAIVIAANPGASGSATIEIRGDGPTSILQFGDASTPPRAGTSKYRFEEAISVTIATSAATATTASSPAAEKMDATRRAPDNAPRVGGGRPPSKGGRDQPDDKKEAGAAPPNAVAESSVTLRMGESATAALPAHARTFSLKSSNEQFATVREKDDQVTISALKEGTADVTITGEALTLGGGTAALGETRPFTRVVHVRVKGPDLTGRWSSPGGSPVTISHTGSRVVLRDALARPWEGKLSGDKLELTHVYARDDVGFMGKQWPEKVQEQLVGKKRRISATVRADGGDLRLVGKLHGLDVKYTETTQTVTSVKERLQDLELRRAQ